MRKSLLIMLLSALNPLMALEETEPLTSKLKKIESFSLENDSISAAEGVCPRIPHCPRGAQGPTGPTGSRGPDGVFAEAYGGLQLPQNPPCTEPTFTGAGGLIPSIGITNFPILNVPSIPLTSLRVTLTNLVHTFSSDLSGFVTLPDTTVVPLFFRFDGSNDYNGTYAFDDQGFSLLAASGNNPIPSATYLATNLSTNHTPVNMNALVDGHNAAGTWTLTIQDHAAGDSGSLGSWSITLNCPPYGLSVTSSFTLLPLAQNGNEFSNITPNGSTMEINTSGDYQISYSILGYGSSAVDEVYAIVGINGDTSVNPTYSATKGANGVITLTINNSKNSIIHLNEGDSIGLYLRTSSPLQILNATISLNAVLLKAD